MEFAYLIDDRGRLAREYARAVPIREGLLLLLVVGRLLLLADRVASLSCDKVSPACTEEPSESR